MPGWSGLSREIFLYAYKQNARQSAGRMAYFFFHGLGRQRQSAAAFLCFWLTLPGRWELGRREYCGAFKYSGRGRVQGGVLRGLLKKPAAMLWGCGVLVWRCMGDLIDWWGKTLASGWEVPKIRKARMGKRWKIRRKYAILHPYTLQNFRNFCKEI